MSSLSGALCKCFNDQRCQNQVWIKLGNRTSSRRCILTWFVGPLKKCIIKKSWSLQTCIFRVLFTAKLATKSLPIFFLPQFLEFPSLFLYSMELVIQPRSTPVSSPVIDVLVGPIVTLLLNHILYTSSTNSIN